jgi:hypothetical protein
MAFNPDDYLAEEQDAATSKFDPDAYLSDTKTATTADLIKGRRALSAPEDSATTSDLIRMRRGAPAMEREGAAEEPAKGQAMVPTAGFMPIDPTSEFAGMDMEPEKRVPTYTVDELAKNDVLFKLITDYAKVTQDKEFKGTAGQKETDRSATTEDLIKLRRGERPEEVQTREKFVADFLSDMRFNEYNTLLGALPTLNFIRNASDEDKKTVAEAYRLYQETAGVDEPGGQKGFRPIADVAKAIVTDPLNFLGFLTSKTASFVLNKSGSRVIPRIVVPKGASEAAKKAAKKANKEALAVSMQDTARRQALTPAITKGTAALTEGSVGLASNIVDQKTRQEVAKSLGEEVPEINAGEAAVATILSTALGYAQGVPAAKEKTTKQFERLGQEIKKRKEQGLIPDDPTTPTKGTEQIAIDAVNENMDKVVKEYTEKEGRKVLEEVGERGILTDPIIREDLSARAVRVAVRIIQADPEFRVKPGQQVSDAINRVFSSASVIDDNVLEQAILAEGLTPDAFAAANKVSVSDAARIMQEYSTASKMITQLGNYDPDFKKRVDELYKKSKGEETKTGIWPAIARILSRPSRLERESKALITSGVDTTVRNVAGTAIGLPLKAGTDLLEGLVYTTGVALTGKGVEATKQAFVNTLKDTVNVWFYLRRGGLSADVSDKLLSASPTLRKTMYNSLQEASINDVSKLAQAANVLNNAQDVFFRRAVFNASVEVQLRRLGVDLYKDILAKDKLVPAQILSRAMDDALKTTFSYMPRVTKDMGLETGVETTVSYAISTIERLPTSSLWITFPRFMANAMAYQYRYSAGFVGGIEDIVKYFDANAAGEVDKAQLHLRKANLKTVQSITGLSLLYQAYEYRLENQDKPAYMLPGALGDKGNATDIRPVFPLWPFFATADLLAKIKLGTTSRQAVADTFQAVIGIKLPAGSQGTLIEKIIQSINSVKSEEDVSVVLGRVVGDFLGRFTQPFVAKNFYDFYDDIFSEGGTIARDPNVLETDDQFLETVSKRVASKLPGEKFLGTIIPGKESLPEAIPRLREGPIYREGQFFNRLVGFRTQTTPSPIEREITKLGLEAYRLYGGSSGDKKYDRGFIEEANKLVLPRLKGVIGTQSYNKKTTAEKRRTISDIVKEQTAIAREINNEKFTATDIKRIYKMRFNRLTEIDRALINERYAKDHGGISLEEANDYMQIEKYIPTLEDTQMSRGGLASRR